MRGREGQAPAQASATLLDTIGMPGFPAALAAMFIDSYPPPW